MGIGSRNETEKNKKKKIWKPRNEEILGWGDS